MRTLAYILLWLSGFALGAALVYASLYECLSMGVTDAIDAHVSTFGGAYFLVFLVLSVGLLWRSRKRTANSN